MHPDLREIVGDRLGDDELERLLTVVLRLHREETATISLTVGPDGARSASDEPTGALGRAGGLPPRYEDRGRLGEGGMGLVRRALDRELGRICAWKSVLPELAARRTAVSRFREEARMGAQLQHPGIPPVYDAGTLSDGRPWFTMKEVRGGSLADQIRALHASGSGEPGLRRLVDAFARVCDAVGYAHTRGVVHRDLKPDNVMLGSDGEVLVLDWGLAKRVGEGDPAEEDVDPGPRPHVTRAGTAMGTPTYMAPEQARGEPVDARADVYALGGVLYTLLAGRPPIAGETALEVLRTLLAGHRPAPPPGPPELVALGLRCLAPDPADRPEDAREVAGAVRAWLDGAHRRDRARARVAEADALVAATAELRARARHLRGPADAALAALPPWEPEDEKAPHWDAQDAATVAEREADDLAGRREILLEGALAEAPDLADAREALLAVWLARHRDAELARDEVAANAARLRAESHLAALPPVHAARVRASAWLRGDGAVTLVTDPPGARVELFRYVIRRRRLQPERVCDLPETPFHAVSLPMGSYLLLVRAPGRTDVRYPIHIDRETHWDGVPPNGTDPLPIRLPPLAELGPDDCYVPAGWFVAGGALGGIETLPRRRLWCDALVVGRFPVTYGEWATFLDDERAAGRDPDRVTARHRGGGGTPVFAHDGERHVLLPDPEGLVWNPRWPVGLVDWAAARACAGSLAARTGRPWRLLGELEWEKAARGVDGRQFPWGDEVDASWCAVSASQRGIPLPSEVTAFPVDESVYGVRGLGGNSMDWCADAARIEGLLPGDALRVPEPDLDTPADVRVVRGGHCVGPSRNARCAARFRYDDATRAETISVRFGYRP